MLLPSKSVFVLGENISFFEIMPFFVVFPLSHVVSLPNAEPCSSKHPGLASRRRDSKLSLPAAGLKARDPSSNDTARPMKNWFWPPAKPVRHHLK